MCRYSLENEILSLFRTNVTLKEETLNNVYVSFSTSQALLPSFDQLNRMIDALPKRDKVDLRMTGLSDCVYSVSSDVAMDNEQYQAFLDEHERDDIINIALSIEKGQIDNCISVYSYEMFASMLTSLSTEKLITLLSLYITKDAPYLMCEVLDSDVYIISKYLFIIGGNVDYQLPEPRERQHDYAKCEETSIFLDRNKLGLIPQDFLVLENSTGTERLANRLNIIGTVMSYIYLADVSYIIDDRLILQFDSGRKYEKILDELSYNTHICDLFLWATANDNVIERTGIIRNTIVKECQDADKLWGMTEAIVVAVRSSYKIYQRQATEEYINTKHKIGEFIVEVQKQMREMIVEMVAGLRNNLLAIITFAISAILSNSIDREILMASGLPSNLQYVSWIFIIASGAYFIISVFSIRKKKKMLFDDFELLKRNYSAILDDNDFAFFEDKDSQKLFTKHIRNWAWWIYSIWALVIVCFIVLLLIFRDAQDVQLFVETFYRC